MSIKLFNEAKAKYMKTLKMYVPVVARVHGQSHPEFHEVHALFDALIKKNGSATGPAGAGRRIFQAAENYKGLRRSG